MNWNLDEIKLSENEKFEHFFDLNQIAELKEICGKEIFKDDKILLSKSPILINDNTKPFKNLNLSLNYYFEKIKHDQLILMIKKDKKYTIKKISNTFKIEKIFVKQLEKLNCEGIDKKYLGINPEFFDTIISENEYTCDELLFFRNIISSCKFGDRLIVSQKDIELSFLNKELEYKTYSLKLNELDNSHMFYWAYKWIKEDGDNQEVLNLRYHVAKIFFIEHKAEKIFNYNSLANELNDIYKVILQQESEKYYIVQKELRDEFLKLNQEKAKINLEFNQKILNLIISIPIAFYGFFFAMKKSNQPLNIFNNELIFLYIFYLIASIYLFFLFNNHISILNKNNEEYINMLKDTYDMSLSKWKNKYKLKKYSDFKLLFVILIFLIILLISILIYYLYKNW